MLVDKVHPDRRDTWKRVAGIIALVSLVGLIFLGARLITHCVLRLDSSGTPRIFGVPLGNPAVRQWVYRGIGFFEVEEIRLQVPADISMTDMLATVSEVRTNTSAGKVTLQLLVR